jgi:AraC-like DNA-binding protein
MCPTAEEKRLYGNRVEVISRDEHCVVYRLTDKTGEAFMTSYTVFPGIELIYNDVHLQHFRVDATPPENMFEINHCHEGRVECEVKSGEYLYVSKGDLAINLKANTSPQSNFPLSHYHGITISIDMDKTNDNISCLLEDVIIDLRELKQKLCDTRSFVVMRENESFEHIFSELYHVPDKIKLGYFRIKVLEVLLFLSGMNPEEIQQNKKYYEKKQVDTIKEIKEYITSNLSRKVTIAQISELFHMPSTSMKLCFKEVYGDSIYSFIKKYKMQQAAILLKESTESVTEIACRLGYDNASKFSEAFRKEFGMSPSVYRKQEQ